MTTLGIDEVSKAFGSTPCLDRLSLEVRSGEFFAVLGPSGCGKTTLLRMIAGFVAPDSGRILFGGGDVTDLPPERRDAAMVFQSYALFPHLDVAQNVAFGLRARRVAPSESEQRVRAALSMVGLESHQQRDVGSLSGGEQQRVALARALVVEPSLLLLDEPMSNLDQKLREATRSDLRALQRRLGVTTLYVTHDQHEALEMADRVAVIDRGRLAQVGTPSELYQRPRSEFVATFLGRANILRLPIVARGDDTVRLRLGETELELTAPTSPSRGAATVALRPESIRLARQLPRKSEEVAEKGPDVGGVRGSGISGDDWIELGTGEVELVEFQGATVQLTLSLGGDARLRVTELNHTTEVVRVGEWHRLFIQRARAVVLEPD